MRKPFLAIRARLNDRRMQRVNRSLRRVQRIGLRHIEEALARDPVPVERRALLDARERLKAAMSLVEGP